MNDEAYVFSIKIFIFFLSIRFSRYNLLRLFHLTLGLSGLEPPTSRLSGVRSNRLSYKPLILQLLHYSKLNQASTYSPTPSPVQYHRPLKA